MKNFLLLVVLLFTGATLLAQDTRIVAVDPGSNAITIQNFGTTTQSITGQQLCHNGSCITIPSTFMLVVTGSYNIPPGDIVIIVDPLMFTLANNGDLALFTQGGSTSNPADMLDYVQWGTGGNAQEANAVTAGLWNAGDAVATGAPYFFSGMSTQHGVNWWDPLVTYERIRISSVNPAQDLVTIANYGGQTIDVTNYVLSHQLMEDTVANLTVEYGNTTLSTGEVVVLSGFPLNDAMGDLALYQPNPVLTDSSYLEDFVQWGAAGQGREALAETREYWTQGDFLTGAGPYGYDGVGFQHGINFWSNSTLALSLSSTAPLCTDSCNATATANASGGGQPYHYLWSNGQTSATANGLCAGSHAVILVDSTGNALIDSVSIANPAMVQVAATPTAASCGASDGSATALASGGAGNYSYLWSDPFAQSTATAAGLMAGTYTVTATDSNGCAAVDSATVQGFGVSTSTGNLPDDCETGTGSAWVSATAGLAPFTYLWSNGATVDSVSSLAQGVYYVTVTAADGCTAVDSATVGGFAAVVLSSASTDAACGQPDGSASVAPTTGNAPYSYAWDAAAASQTDSLATALAAGNYSVTVTDGNGCTAATTVGVNDAGNVSGSVSSTDATCQLADGTATVTPAGGTAPYSYQWDASAGAQTDSTASGLLLGSYAVTVTDASGCIFDTVVQVDTVNLLTLSLMPEDDSCNTASGLIVAAVTGGSVPYTYQWSTGGSTSHVSGLMPGTYTLTISEGSGCMAIDSITVGGTPEFAVSAAVSNATCQQSDGQASVAAAGLGGPYSYQWDAAAGSATDSLVTGLAPGSYAVTVVDAAGCAQDTVLEVMGQELPSVDFASVDVACFGDSTGEISANAFDGTAPYSFAWSNGDAGGSVDGLPAGDYFCTVTDVNGCTASGGISILQPTALSVSVVAVEHDTMLCDGEVLLAVSGGTQPYLIEWNSLWLAQTIADGPNPQGICGPDSLTALVTDLEGCTDSIGLYLDGPSAVQALAAEVQLELWPNPSDGRFTVRTAEPVAKAAVFAVDGKRVDCTLQLNASQLKVDGLKPGSYVLQLTLHDGRVAHRKVLVW